MIKGWIFDLDGVITDTAEFHFKAWKKLAEEENLPFTREDNEQLRGVSRADSLKLLLKGKKVSQEHFEDMMTRKNKDYQALVEGMGPADALPGARELVKKLRNAGIRTAIGSSSRNAQRVIELLQMENLFDGVADGHSVENAKPAPDLFLHAAELLGLSPEECIVVEDAEAGVEAALAGGMTVVGVGPVERVGKAHFVFGDTSSIDPELVMNRKLH
ncbi:beta-phosphoglucomutase [Spirochaeta dissipatitropha]